MQLINNNVPQTMDNTEQEVVEMHYNIWRDGSNKLFLCHQWEYIWNDGDYRIADYEDRKIQGINRTHSSEVGRLL